jgi:hypothetical protein
LIEQRHERARTTSRSPQRRHHRRRRGHDPARGWSGSPRGAAAPAVPRLRAARARGRLPCLRRLVRHRQLRAADSVKALRRTVGVLRGGRTSSSRSKTNDSDALPSRSSLRRARRAPKRDERKARGRSPSRPRYPAHPEARVGSDPGSECAARLLRTLVPAAEFPHRPADEEERDEEPAERERGVHPERPLHAGHERVAR